MTQTETRERNTGRTVGAFLAGALTTLAVGGYALYGPNGKRHRKQLDSWVAHAKAEILERIDQIEDLTEQGYNAIVDEVMAKYEGTAEVTKEKAEMVGEKFKRGWGQVRTRTKNAARRAANKAADTLDDVADSIDDA